MERVMAFFRRLMESENFGKNLDNVKFISKIIAIFIIVVIFIFEICQ